LKPCGHWEHFAHEADIGIRGVGPSKEAALALTAVMADPRSVAPKQPVHIACRGPEDDLLLVDWLNALIFDMATRRILFGRFEVRPAAGQPEATAGGETVEVSIGPPSNRKAPPKGLKLNPCLCVPQHDYGDASRLAVAKSALALARLPVWK